MTKIFPFALLIILTHTVFGQRSLKTLIKENEKSVFLIQCYNDKNELVSTGSGFFIDVSGTALTNVHVIKDAYKAKIKTVENKFYEVEKVLDYNPGLDIAKIKVKGTLNSKFPQVKLATKKMSKGDEVFAIGNPDGLESTVSTGIISSIREIANYGECYQITAPISPGSSGGALFNMDGEVIGITSFGQIDPGRLNQNLNFAVNIDNAKYLTKNLNLTTEKAYREVTYEDFVNAYMRAYLSGDFKRAIEICNQQLQKKPNSWLAYHYRASVYIIIDQFSEAEQDLKKSIQLNNTNNLKEWDYIGLGKIYRKAGLYQDAKDAYFKALEINDKNAACFCNLSILAYDWLGPDNELVEQSYLMALQIDPTSCSFGYKKMGEKLIAKREYEKAAEYFSLSIATEKDETLSLNEYFNRGTCYYYLKQYGKAILDFQYCIKLMANDYQSYLSIGLCYVGLGKKLDACAAFRKADEINKGINKSKEADETIQIALNQYCR